MTVLFILREVRVSRIAESHTSSVELINNRKKSRPFINRAEGWSPVYMAELITLVNSSY